MGFWTRSWPKTHGQGSLRDRRYDRSGRGAGEVTTKCYVDVEEVVRQKIKGIGYTDPRYNFDYQSWGVTDGIKKQSTDIDLGLSKSLEAKMEKKKKI